MEAFIIFQAVIALALKLVNILIHGIGFCLLRGLQQNGKGNVQTVYITNLSFTELIINLLSFIRNLSKLIVPRGSGGFNYAITYSYIFDYAILKFSLYMTMIVITLDRMFLILLNVTYPVHWNLRRAKHLIKLIWVVSFLLFMATTVVHTLNRNTHQFFNIANYVVISFDFTFLFIAVISYSTIFIKFKRRRTRLSQKTSGSKTQASLWRTFSHSRFYVVLLLILTFVIFVMPADMVWNFYALDNPNKIVELLTTISYAVSYLSDGLIYIFMNNKVKRSFLKKVCNIRLFSVNFRSSMNLNSELMSYSQPNHDVHLTNFQGREKTQKDDEGSKFDVCNGRNDDYCCNNRNYNRKNIASIDKNGNPVTGRKTGCRTYSFLPDVAEENATDLKKTDRTEERDEEEESFDDYDETQSKQSRPVSYHNVINITVINIRNSQQFEAAETDEQVEAIITEIHPGETNDVEIESK